MARGYQITAEQKLEIEKARKRNHDKKIEKKLWILCLRAEGKSLNEIAAMVEFHPVHVSQIVSQYIHKGLAYMLANHYLGNRRNMSYEQEEAILAPFLEKAEQGHIVSVREIAKAYQDAVTDHKVSPTQIYAVLKRHNWRKVMPRSRHPKKASESAIADSKKLTLASGN